CDYDGHWNDVTLNCRGLVIQDDGAIIARPLRKFFNYGELERRGLQAPSGPFEVYEKEDGCLGIVYYYAGDWHIATRGSFTSWQAQRAQKILDGLNTRILHPSFTYLFEIILPDFRIVVDYGGAEELVLLAGLHLYRHNEELDYDRLQRIAQGLGCRCVVRHTIAENPAEFLTHE